MAQAISTYTMTVFKLPNSQCEDLTSMIHNFWWGQRNDERKIAWMNWEKLCASKSCGRMCFKKLKEFNLALLAKQGWRLQQGHDSLVHKVLKAKYFPTTEFSQAVLGNNPSFTWRNIMAAQPLIKYGLWWRLGNGERIRIWGDKWLPKPLTFMVSSPRLFMPQDMKVGELIDKEVDSWKVGAVDALFLPHEAEAIKAIPISTNLPEDKQIWAWSTNGVFSVKNAYWVASQMSLVESTGSSSEGSQERSFWKSIWQINVPHKIKHFAWRACRDILPLKTNLVKRNVLQVDTCDECNVEAEDSIHFFWKCTSAKEMWSSSKLVFPNVLDQLSSFKEMMWCLMMDEKCSSENIELIFTCAWALWGNRNDIRHGGTRKDGRQLLHWASQYLEEYRTAVDLLPHVLRWCPLPAPYLKFNVDGAIFTELRSVGIEIIVRDWNGRSVAAMCKHIHAPLGPLEAESKAVEVGLQFAKQHGVSDFIIEGDSLIVSSALSQSSSVPTSIDAVIMGIRSAAWEFHSVYFSHVKHNANNPAHLLAKYAKGIVHQCMWMENCPSFLKLAILHDVNSTVI
ncbi:hypothetical protein SO802_004498 [Lithocarpus litseifolius]|uniref:Reverse transcriptase zinc-binding domain-containing protein n=1 Tax=Lithocarpus litseifolius TaxID=425828 RepID=A0AAW2E528_9ROSI